MTHKPILGETSAVHLPTNGVCPYFSSTLRSDYYFYLQDLLYIDCLNNFNEDDF